MLHKVSGKVIKGDSYGRKLGFPTVNLDTVGSEVQKIPEGVYSGVAELEGLKYLAGIVIGPESKVEAHLIGYSGDAYGKLVVLEINKFLRKFKKFDTEKELIEQIRKDIQECSQV